MITERLSPLNVSIHATEPELRSRMLKNPRGGMSLRWLRALLDHGITVRGQIVVCPGVNDGAVLDRTFADVLDKYPELESIAVVPLGLSRFNTESAMRLHTLDEADAVIDAVHDWQDIYLRVLGRRMVFAADEYYLMTGRPFPDADSYEGFGCTRTASAWPARSSSSSTARSTRPPACRAGSSPPSTSAPPEPGRRTPACAVAQRSAPAATDLDARRRAATRRSASSPASSVHR